MSIKYDNNKNAIINEETPFFGPYKWIINSQRAITISINPFLNWTMGY
jgi:hypothetical protein